MLRNETAWSKNTRARRRIEAFNHDPHCHVCKRELTSYKELKTLDLWRSEQWIGCAQCASEECNKRRVVTWLLAPQPKPLYKLLRKGRSQYDDVYAYSRRYNHQRNVDIVRYYHHVCPHCSTFTPEVNDWLIYNRYAGCAHCAEYTYNIYVNEQTFGIVDIDGIVDTGDSIPMQLVKPADIAYSKKCKVNPANAHYAY